MSNSLEVSRYLTTGAFLGAKSAQLLDQPLSRYPEDAGRTALVAGGETQHLTDVLGLDLRQRRKRTRVGHVGSFTERAGTASQHLGRQVLALHAARFLQEHHPLDQVPQLAHVARPRVAEEMLRGFRRQFGELLLKLARELVQKVTRQEQDVVASIPERRQV